MFTVNTKIAKNKGVKIVLKYWVCFTMNIYYAVELFFMFIIRNNFKTCTSSVVKDLFNILIQYLSNNLKNATLFHFNCSSFLFIFVLLYILLL